MGLVLARADTALSLHSVQTNKTRDKAVLEPLPALEPEIHLELLEAIFVFIEVE